MDKKEISVNAGENVKHRSRREWVKNIIIVFLLIMLILTFFSNTIMNYSLPEVSVTRISRDKVSKSYTLDLSVEANKTYSVTADESREIKRVAVRKGQQIKEGQILFYLEEVKDSAEAKLLQEQIDAERTAYEKALITASDDYFTFNQAVQVARDKLNQYINEKNNASSSSSGSSSDSKDILEKKAMLTSDLENITAGSYDRLSSEIYAKISDEHKAYTKAENEYNTAEEKCRNYTSVITNAGAENGVKPLERNLEEQKLILEQKKSELAVEYNIMTAQEIASLELKIKYAEEDLEEVKNAITALEEANTEKNEKLGVFETAKKNLDKKVSEVSSYISAEISSLNSDSYEGGSGMISPDTTDYDELIRNAQYELDAAVNALEKQIESDRIEDAQTALDLSAQKKKIESLEEDLEKLLSKQNSTEVTSPLEGVVEEIKFASGQSFAEGEELLVLNLSDDGFTAAATVSAEQAKVLKKGAEAKIADKTDNVKVTVKNIVKDKKDSSVFSITFAIEGDAVAGQNIKVELGDAASQFDKVVPRSAVNKDSSGAFVYVVRAKSTPLGNRYLAEKVAVTVVAEDDTQCAVSGDFGDSADYIITASSKPFLPGDQVRFAQE